MADVAVDPVAGPAPAGTLAPSGDSRLGSTPAGTLYRGREGMWSWVAHRITGVLIFFFLFAHVLDTALVRVSPNSYDTVIRQYKNPFINLMEVGLAGAVLFHALNGLRIITIDFWSKGTRHQKKLLYIELVLFVILFIPAAFFMLRHEFLVVFGSVPS